MSKESNLKAFTIKIIVVAAALVLVILILSIGSSLFFKDRYKDNYSLKDDDSKSYSFRDLCRLDLFLEFGSDVDEFDSVIMDRIISLDPNRDNNFTTDELASIIDSYKTTSSEGIDKRDFNRFFITQIEEVLNLGFNSFDQDGDSEISFEEFEVCLD